MPRRSYSRNSPINAPWLSGRRSPIIIFETHDVIFPKVRTVLNFNDVQRVLSEVFKAVFRLYGNRRALPHVQFEHLIASRHMGRPRNHDPMLAPLMMQLQRQSTTRMHGDSLDLVSGALFENRIRSPRPMDRQVLEMLGGSLLLENIDDLLDVLGTGLRTDERCIGGINHNHVD